MVEPEMAYFSLEDLLAMEEEFVSYIVQTVLETRKLELALIDVIDPNCRTSKRRSPVSPMMMRWTC